MPLKFMAGENLADARSDSAGISITTASLLSWPPGK
jgi:hypothetical protein